eukprot:XP_011609029.1 PREDICTED: putative fibroblast growth factor 1 isoform X1 [Takifugu rubripes]
MADDGAAAFDVQAVGGGFPRDYRRLTQLYCMNGGHHLQILPDGTVQGLRDDGDAHTVLKLKAVDRGVVVIRGTEAARYLAMNDQGRLYGSVSKRTHLQTSGRDESLTSTAKLTINSGRPQPTVTDECYFLEKLEENHYNTYMSRQYQDRNWYVALKKNGKPKLGPRTHVGQKAVFFLPRQLQDSSE